jgi:hypothetical protein
MKTGSGTTNWTFTITGLIYDTEVCNLDATGYGSAAIQDSGGNILLDFTDASVTNSSAQTQIQHAGKVIIIW